MQRDRRIGEVIELDVLPDQPPQLAVGHKMIAPAARTADERAQADGKDVLPLQVAPHSAQLPRCLRGLGPRCDKGGVERADRGADQKIGRNAPLVQGLEHPDLQCAEARAAGETDRRPRPRSACVWAALRAMERGTPGNRIHGAYLNGWRNASAALTGGTPNATRKSDRVSWTMILVCPLSRSHSSLTVRPSLCRVSSSTNIERSRVCPPARREVLGSGAREHLAARALECA